MYETQYQKRWNNRAPTTLSQHASPKVQHCTEVSKTCWTPSSLLNWGPLAMQPTPSRNKSGSQMYGALTLISLLSYSNIHFIISNVCWPQIVSENHSMPTKFLQRSRALSRVLHPTRQTPPQRRGLFQDQLGIHSTWGTQKNLQKHICCITLGWKKVDIQIGAIYKHKKAVTMWD